MLSDWETNTPLLFSHGLSVAIYIPDDTFLSFSRSDLVPAVLGEDLKAMIVSQGF